MLGVPKVTIRHDLEWLEKQVFLKRTHGGAILDQRVRLEPEYAHSIPAYLEEKHLLAQRLPP